MLADSARVSRGDGRVRLWHVLCITAGRMSLSRFKRSVVTCDEGAPIGDAARKLRDERVGCVIVTRQGYPAGVLTDRDLTLRVLAEGRNPQTTRVSDVVTFDPITINENDGIETAAARMRDHGIRRLPIVDGAGNVVGIVTADDLMILLGRELADLCEGIESSSDSSESR